MVLLDFNIHLLVAILFEECLQNINFNLQKYMYVHLVFKVSKN